MKKRNLFLLVGIFLSITTLCDAQTVSVNQLVNTKWYCGENKSIDEFMEFSKDSIRQSYENLYIHRTITFSKPFYLSNNKKEVFDMKKVGTPTSGKYLLRWNMKMKGKEYCEITTLTKDSLVLFFEAQPNHIGAEDVYFTYKRVR